MLGQTGYAALVVAKDKTLGVEMACQRQQIWRLSLQLTLLMGYITQYCLIYIRRLLTVNDEPAFYHREYLIHDPTRPIVEAELEVTALPGLFDGTGSALLKWGELRIVNSMDGVRLCQRLLADRPEA